MENPGFDEVVSFIQTFIGLRSQKSITPETKLEQDLGITGMDGDDLLKEAESHFSISFPSDEERFRMLFDLKENEYLFNAEGLDLLGIESLIRWIRKQPKPVIRDLSVGKFHQVLNALKQTQSVV